MPCAFTVAQSPAFIPSPRVSPIFCKPAASLSPSPSSPVLPSPSPLSPLTLRLHKQTSNLINSSLNREEPVCSTSSRSGTPSTLLKRKRPARIDVPATALSFEAMVQTARGRDRLDDDVVAVEEEIYSVFCKRGRRSAMEDRFSALLDFQRDSKQAFFGVFDGHGGAKAAEYAAKNIGTYIMDEVEKRSEERIEEAVKEGYLTTDAEFLKEEIDGGTCSVTALIRQGNLVVSNAGDCRAVMSRRGVAEALTVDHRPSRDDERERIQSMGGYVDCRHGVWRIQGLLAVSRGIGDRYLKQWVIAEPETRTIQIGAECEFLILASDGLWDKVSNQEAVDIVRPLCVGVDNPNALSACKKLVDLSLKRGSSDDVSVMVIQLGLFIQ